MDDGLVISCDVSKLFTSDNELFDGHFGVWVLEDVKKDKDVHLDLTMDTYSKP